MTDLPHSIERFVRDADDGMQSLWLDLESLRNGYVAVKRVDKQDLDRYAKWFSAQVNDFFNVLNTGNALLRENLQEFVGRSDPPSERECAHQVSLYVGLVRRSVDIRKSTMKVIPPYVWEESRNDLLLAIDSFLDLIRKVFFELSEALENREADGREGVSFARDWSVLLELVECLPEWKGELYEELLTQKDGAWAVMRPRRQRATVFGGLVPGASAFPALALWMRKLFRPFTKQAKKALEETLKEDPPSRL